MTLLLTIVGYAVKLRAEGSEVFNGAIDLALLKFNRNAAVVASQCRHIVGLSHWLLDHRAGQFNVVEALPVVLLLHFPLIH